MLEIGSGNGDLLAAVEPGTRRRHRRQRRAWSSWRARGIRRSDFEQAAGEDFALDETFDYVVMSDLVPYVDDLLALFQNVAAHSTRDTRIVVHSYSQLWRPALARARACCG